MPHIQMKREFPGRTPKECYSASIAALHEANFKIFKQRDYAWFVIASQTIDNKELTCNLFTNSSTSTVIELNMSSSALSIDRLETEANQLLGLILKRLS